MGKELRKGDNPLFNMDEKRLIRFVYNSKKQLVMDAASIEMTRRLKESIDKFTISSNREAKEMKNLSIWMMILAIITTILTLIQVVMLFY